MIKKNIYSIYCIAFQRIQCLVLLFCDWSEFTDPGVHHYLISPASIESRSALSRVVISFQRSQFLFCFEHKTTTDFGLSSCFGVYLIKIFYSKKNQKQIEVEQKLGWRNTGSSRPAEKSCRKCDLRKAAFHRKMRCRSEKYICLFQELHRIFSLFSQIVKSKLVTFNTTD